MPGKPSTQVLARLDRGAVAVAFDQPVLVVGPAEAANRLPQVFERVEALDPEHLLLASGLGEGEQRRE
jgi:hypothetical protein